MDSAEKKTSTEKIFILNNSFLFLVFLTLHSSSFLTPCNFLESVNGFCSSSKIIANRNFQPTAASRICSFPKDLSLQGIMGEIEKQGYTFASD